MTRPPASLPDTILEIGQSYVLPILDYPISNRLNKDERLSGVIHALSAPCVVYFNIAINFRVCGMTGFATN